MKTGKYIGNCASCDLMLMKKDLNTKTKKALCPRCGKNRIPIQIEEIYVEDED